MKLLKHPNNTDVAMLVLKSFYVLEGDYFKLKVRWMNIVNPENIYSTDILENIEISAKDYSKWEVIG